MTPGRQRSLDLFRGAIVALLVLLEWLPPSPHYAALRHSPWNGVRVADFVFPAFLFLVGTSAAIAEQMRGPAAPARLARRAVSLLVLGLLFNAWGDSGADLAGLRLPGVLQMIAVSGLLAGLVTRVVRRPVVVASLAAGLTLGHGLLLSLGTTSCGRGVLQPGCSVAWAVDRHLFGLDHLYHHGAFGHDPEGLLTSVLGATSLVLAGWVVARLLDDRLRVALVGLGLAAAALLASIVWSPNKRLWTPSFGLLMAATSTACLLALAIIFDRPRPRWVEAIEVPVVALGQNALLVYLGQHLLLASLQATPAGTGTLAERLLERSAEVMAGPRSLLVFAAGGLVLWTLVAVVLRRLGWTFRV